MAKLKVWRCLVLIVGMLGVLLLLASLLLDVIFPDTQFSIGSWTHAPRDTNFGIIQQIGTAIGFLVALVGFTLYRRLS